MRYSITNLSKVEVSHIIEALMWEEIEGKEGKEQFAKTNDDLFEQMSKREQLERKHLMAIASRRAGSIARKIKRETGIEVG